LEENKDKKDPLEDYLPPYKIEDKDHIVQITSVKFEDLKGMTTSDQIWSLLTQIRKRKEVCDGNRGQ
jgi:hypothetical protein